MWLVMRNVEAIDVRIRLLGKMRAIDLFRDGAGVAQKIIELVDKRWRWSRSKNYLFNGSEMALKSMSNIQSYLDVIQIIVLISQA